MSDRPTSWIQPAPGRGTAVGSRGEEREDR